MVEEKIRNCLACLSTSQQRTKNPPIMSKLPDGPWKEIGIDFFGPIKNSHYYLVIYDEYSRFPIVNKIISTSAKAVIPKLDEIFSLIGIPNVVKSDNGPPFQSEDFQQFANYLGFKHRKITPHWPKANSETERFMKSLKKVIQTAAVESANEAQQINKFLTSYRATPHTSTKVSPHQVLFGEGNTTSRLCPEIKNQDIDLEKNIRENDLQAKKKNEEKCTNNKIVF